MTSFTPEDSIRARGLHVVIESGYPFDKDAARKMIELHRIAESRARDYAAALQRQLAGEIELKLAERQLRKSWERIAYSWKWTAIGSIILSAGLIVGMVVR